VRSARYAAIGLLMLAIVVGTLSDRPHTHPLVVIGGYRVLAVDFHTHSSMWSDGALTPWGLVLEAERQGLDAIAITGHNQIADGQVGRWFSRLVGGPIVLPGEEITSPSYHLIAVGIEKRVSSRQPAAGAMDDVHRQGGIAIAAHPLRDFWVGYDDAAISRLDGAEFCHPIIYAREGAESELEEFAARARVAAIGSSDFHGFGAMGACRTYVFARDASAQAIVDAVRAHRTVVYLRDGRARGDPDLVRLAASDSHLREAALADPRGSPLDWFSRIAGVVGLAGVLAFGTGRRQVAA
jgi:predicted metal-dependent phosphoesterase TrpH